MCNETTRPRQPKIMIHSIRIPFAKPRDEISTSSSPTKTNITTAKFFPLAALSPTMDLIALGHTSVAVNRSIEWERVFAHNGNATNVTAMAFRPDGKVLAVAFENGEVFLLGIENAVDDRLRPARAFFTSKTADEVVVVPSSSEKMEIVIEPSTPPRQITHMQWTATRVRQTASSAAASSSPPPAVAWSAAPASYASELLESPALDLFLTCDDGGVITLRTFLDFTVGCTGLRGCFRSRGEEGINAAEPLTVIAHSAKLSPNLGNMVAVMEREGGGEEARDGKHRSVARSLGANRAGCLEALASLPLVGRGD